MDYFLWNTGGDMDDEALVFVQDHPEGMGLDAVTLTMGKPAGNTIPEPPRIKLRPENKGLALPGFIGNTKNLLLLSPAGVEVLKRLCADQKLELYPFELINHKGRVHTSDYFIVNPLDTLACLDEAASGVQRDANGRVTLVEKLVLARARLEDAPHLFRVAEEPVNYVFSRTLGRAFNDAGVTNIRGRQLRQV